MSRNLYREIHDEAVANHYHSWQAGPLVNGAPAYFAHDEPVPDSVLLICACGRVERLAIPKLGKSTALGSDYLMDLVGRLVQEAVHPTATFEEATRVLGADLEEALT